MSYLTRNKLLAANNSNSLSYYYILVQNRNASHSSESWLNRQRNDEYVKLARYHNYKSRAAFKLIQIDDKYKFLKPGKIVIDVGAAPGSWTQVICERLKLKDDAEKKGLCIAVDLRRVDPVEGAICLSNVDFTCPSTQSKLLDWLDGRLADVIVSDMSPDVSGQKYLDHERIMMLNHKLLPFAFKVLKPLEGYLLMKMFSGYETEHLVKSLEQIFESVQTVKPHASRGDSRESFILCMKYKGV